MNNLLRPILIGLWSGLLAIPFMGIINALLVAGVVCLGLVLWHISRKPAVSASVARLFEPLDRCGRRGAQWLSTGGGPRRAGAIVALLSLLTLLPFALNSYFLDVAVLVGIYIILALGLNIVVGLAGLLVLGYIAFYAVGAYAYALLSVHYQISFWLALPLGGLLAALFGLLLGAPTLRLRGDYLAVVTLGFGEMVRITLNNWDSLTNGPNGILGIAAPAVGSWRFSSLTHYYYLVLALVIITAIAVDRLNNSRLGRAWVAIREDETAAEAMGINTTLVKLQAFALSSFWAGMAGVVYAGKMRFISPESFTFSESVMVLCMVVLGGLGSIAGVVLGALLLVVLPEALREVQNYRMLIFGAAMVLMMIFRPQGLLGSRRRRVEMRPDDDKTVMQERQSVFEAGRGAAS